MTDAESSAFDFPSEPALRHITPAPEDYADTLAPASLLWPLAWVGLMALILLVL